LPGGKRPGYGAGVTGWGAKTVPRREWQRKKRAARRQEHQQALALTGSCPWPRTCATCRREGRIDEEEGIFIVGVEEEDEELGVDYDETLEEAA